jgi:hypothetical protein
MGVPPSPPLLPLELLEPFELLESLEPSGPLELLEPSEPLELLEPFELSELLEQAAVPKKPMTMQTGMNRMMADLH